MYNHDRLFVRVCAMSTGQPGATLRGLAQALGVHPHTVALVVREHTGEGFSSWRSRHRLSLSRTLLETRADLSIKEIAALAGFNSTSVFDRFVRRACGRSPSHCRAPREHSGAIRPNVNAFDDRSTLEGAEVRGLDATLGSLTASLL